MLEIKLNVSLVIVIKIIRKMKALKITGLGMQFLFLITIYSCFKKEVKKTEQLTIDESENSSAFDSLYDSVTDRVNHLESTPNSVILTGIEDIKLIPIYKVRPNAEKNLDNEFVSTYDTYSEEYEISSREYKYYMPGLDVYRGYYMINIGHYNINTEKLTYFFNKPVLIRNLYFPGVLPDTLNNKKVERNFFLVSVYDEDTDKDSLINNKDLRKIFYINKDNNQKKSLLPQGYSAVRSRYDFKNDIFYLHARKDINKNGRNEIAEPIELFWLKFSQPDRLVKMI